jgi:hypothetical protein
VVLRKNILTWYIVEIQLEEGIDGPNPDQEAINELVSFAMSASGYTKAGLKFVTSVWYLYRSQVFGTIVESGTSTNIRKSNGTEVMNCLIIIYKSCIYL